MDPIYQTFSAWFTPVKFTASGRPEFTEGEIELLVSPKTNYYEGSNKVVEFQQAMMTSHRLIYIHSDKSKSFSFPLRHCRAIEKETPWFKTPRIVFHLRDLSNDKTIKTPGDVDKCRNGPAPSSISPSFFSIGIKDSNIYKRMLSYAELVFGNTYNAWKEELQLKVEPKIDLGANDQRAQNVGVTGILRRKEEQRRQQTSTLNEAMNDLDSLMKSAQQVTGVLEKLSAKAHQQQLKQQHQTKDGGNSNETTSPTSGNGGSGDGDGDGDELDESETNSIQQMLHTMGFISPVTKATSGALYQEQLSRQLFDFCMQLFKTYSHTIVLTDLFCLYNKVRGTDLISPTDLLQACQLWSELKLNIKFKRLTSSSTYVVQSPLYNEEHEQFRIYIFLLKHYYRQQSDTPALSPDAIDQLETYDDASEFIKTVKSSTSSLSSFWGALSHKKQYHGISSLEISQQLKISLQIVKEYLIVLETQNRIIRDTTHQSVYYYCNLIPFF